MFGKFDEKAVRRAGDSPELKSGSALALPVYGEVLRQFHVCRFCRSGQAESVCKLDVPACQKVVSTLTKAGRYELREELGHGAMGVVYHAHDPVIGREVAVKTMHLSETGTGMSREQLVGRFQTEARAAGLLTHPNIVVIYDAGEEEGLFYITMELVEGRSLQTLLDARQLFPLPRVMKLMEQVCSALDFAHQHGVVHRDIKPANLMMTADETVKITDFGTAKILQFGTAQTVHVMGTPSYMSPEQVKGKPVDGRSDIFSLGVILYELMTGEKPFPGQNITTVIYKIINEEPIPPRSLDSSIHPGLSAVITRALAKDPAMRFQTCHDLLDALKRYHELASAESTVRLAPVKPQPTTGGVRSGATPVHQPAMPVNTRANNAGLPVRKLAPAAWEHEEPSKSKGTLLLSLILIAIIGFAGYRIYPPMMDLWQRAEQSVQTPPAPVKSAPVAPAASSDGPPPADSPALKSLPVAAGNTVPVKSSQSPATPPPAVKHIEPVAAQAARSTETKGEKSEAPQKQAAAVPPSAASAFESVLRSQLADLPIDNKVKLQANANTLTLSGRLTLAEHRELLSHLHAVPADVRIVDNIEYTQNAKETAAPASAGWIWVRSDPEGAAIFVDETDTGLHTPARFEIQQGQHDIRLSLGGFANAQRTFQVQSGQTIEFTEPLARQ